MTTQDKRETITDSKTDADKAVPFFARQADGTGLRVRTSIRAGAAAGEQLKK